MIEFFNNNFFKVRLSIYSIQYNNLFSIIIIICFTLVLQESFHTNLVECMGDQSPTTQEKLYTVLQNASKRGYMLRVDSLTAQFAERTARQEALFKSMIEEMEKQEASLKATLDSRELWNRQISIAVVAVVAFHVCKEIFLAYSS